MKILIVEDQEIKRNEMSELVGSIFNNHISNIQTVPDYRPAMAYIAYMDWDLILLDMSFEANKGTDDETGFQSLAGLQVLQHMRRLNKRIPVLIVTSHNEFSDDSGLYFGGIKELNDHLIETFSDFYKGTVQYKQDAGIWKEHVRSILSNVFN